MEPLYHLADFSRYNNNSMKIIYDARYLLLDERFDGVSRYTYELAWALNRQPDIELTWLVYDDRQRAKLPAGEHVVVNDPQDILRETFVLPRQLNKLDCDVVYSPFFMMGTLGHRYPLILTIHDMIYFTHRTPPYQFSWWIRAGWWLFHVTYWPLRWTLNQASAVATVSATARQELLEAKATKREITTVLNAVAQDVKPLGGNPHHESTDIIYMGAFTPYKNVECLIDAMRELPDMKLHLLSKMPPVRREMLENRMHERGVYDQIIIHDGVSDETYRNLLADCRCLVTASKLEGFGLPVIEAQQQGVPVVCSDTPIFHEVGAHSVLYFDPDSPLACAAQVKSLSDKKTSEDYIARGLQNVKRFTWDDSAKAAVKVCRSIVKL